MLAWPPRAAYKSKYSNKYAYIQTNARTELNFVIVVILILEAPNFLFLGGNDLAEQDVWRWSSDNSVFNYTYWGADEPDKPQERCLVMWPRTKVWIDILCSNEYRFVCQAPL